MINGGNSAAGKVGSQRLNYSHVYIPCQAYTFSTAIATALQATGKSRKYNAYATIETDSGTVDLVTCSYFQVQRKSIGTNDSASLTIQKPEVWSVWGSSYPGVLAPSKKVLTIYCGLPGEEVPIYYGRITSMTESLGSNGGAININCSDFRVNAKREDCVQKLTEHTKYYEFHRQVNEAFKSSGQVLAFSDNDAVGTFTSTGTKLDAANKVISGAQTWQASPSGTITAGVNANQLILGDDVILLDDRMIYSATHSMSDSSSFNTVATMGLVGGTLTTDTVEDVADVAKRGRIEYANTIGTEQDTLADINVIANSMISASLQGGLSAQIVFNPYMCSGMILRFQSTRFNISETIATLSSVRHQYSWGSCTTSLDGLEVW